MTVAMYFKSSYHTVKCCRVVDNVLLLLLILFVFFFFESIFFLGFLFFLRILFHLSVSLRNNGIRVNDLSALADSTQSQVVRREVDGHIEELQALGELRHQEMKGEIIHLQEMMTHLSQQVVDLLCQNVNQNRGHYQAPTKFTKMDLPKFTKDDVVGWLSKCESYFDLDKTPEENKVVMASLTLDEIGYQWFDGLKESTDEPITWHVFFEGICVRFSATLLAPLEELVQLKQKGSLIEYQERFDKIACRSNLTEQQKLNCYMGGLKEEIAWDV